MTEHEITFESQELALAGTLTRPAHPTTGAAALLIVGSGPIDRNSDAKRLPLGITRHLAHHLAELGIGSLRFDKRGVGASEGDYRSAGFLDNVADATAALDALRRQANVDGDRVFIVGHSEGALIATAIAADDSGLAGVVLLAGSAHTGKAVLEHQARHLADLLPAPVQRINRVLRIDVERSQLKRMARLEASTGDVVRMQGIVKVNARWFREFMAFDPAGCLAAIESPVLAITGDHDTQVDPGDVALMERLVQGPFAGHVVSGVNHILRAGPGSPTGYRKLVGLPLDDGVMTHLTQWFEEQAASGQTRRGDAEASPR